MLVLVVDRDPGALASIVQSLRAEGCSVEGATDFQAALLLLTRKPDVIVADVRLGAYNGIHLVMHARRVDPDVHAIITGGPEDAPLRADAEALDAIFVAKPYNLRELAAHINACDRAHDRRHDTAAIEGILQDQMSPVGKTPNVGR
jgi:DNA-binding response OmpR family regulator